MAGNKIVSTRCIIREEVDGDVKALIIWGVSLWMWFSQGYFSISMQSETRRLLMTHPKEETNLFYYRALYSQSFLSSPAVTLKPLAANLTVGKT